MTESKSKKPRRQMEGPWEFAQRHKLTVYGDLTKPPAWENVMDACPVRHFNVVFSRRSVTRILKDMPERDAACFLAALAARAQWNRDYDWEDIVLRGARAAGVYKRGLTTEPTVPFHHHHHHNNHLLLQSSVIPDTLGIMHQLGMPSKEIVDWVCRGELPSFPGDERQPGESVPQRERRVRKRKREVQAGIFSRLRDRFHSMVAMSTPTHTGPITHPWRLAEKLRAASRSMRYSQVTRFPLDVRRYIVQAAVREFYMQETEELAEGMAMERIPVEWWSGGGGDE